MRMQPGTEKIRRLVTTAKMYYEENMTQAEIARYFSVSRPMVSKLLAEAKDMGIVTIHIRDIETVQQITEDRLAEKYGLQAASIVSGSRKEGDMEDRLVEASCQILLDKLKEGCCFGLGWGSVVGKTVNRLTELDVAGVKGTICPLIGNAGASYRSYHTNELVRVVAGKTGLTPHYIYAPAIAESQSEKELYEKTDGFIQIQDVWKRLNLAFINVSNYPSSPDMATAFRFGGRLLRERAVGHVVSHFYDENGTFIEAEQDCALSIPIPLLKKADCVVGVFPAAASEGSARGALRTGLITHAVLSQGLAAQLLQE